MSDEEPPSVTVEEPPVSLVRDATLRSGGLIVEFRLETTSNGAREARVEQELPAELDIADAGFARDGTPDECSIEERTVAFEETVPPGGRELTFGLSVDDGSAPPERLPEPTLSVVGGPDDGIQGADPATLEEAIRRVEAGEAPTPDLSDRLSAGVEPDDGEETVELTREEVARRNEQLMWLRAKATVAERRRSELREAVVALRDALAGVDGVDPDSLPGADLLEVEPTPGTPSDHTDGEADDGGEPSVATGQPDDTGREADRMHEDAEGRAPDDEDPASLASPSED